MRNRCGPIHISIPHMEDLARLMPDAMRQVNCVGGVKGFRAFRDRRSSMLDLHNTNKQRTTAKYQSVCGCTYGHGREHGVAYLAGPPHVHVSVRTYVEYVRYSRAIVLQIMPPPQQPESVDTECSKMSASLMSFSGRIHFLLHRALTVWGRSPGLLGTRTSNS